MRKALEGTVRLGAAGAIPDDRPVSLLAAVTLDLNGIDETIGSLTGGPTSIVQLGAGFARG